MTAATVIPITHSTDRDAIVARLVNEHRHGLLTRAQLRAFADGDSTHPAAIALRALGHPVTFPFQLGATKLLIAAVDRGGAVDWGGAKDLDTHRMLGATELLTLATRCGRLKELHDLARQFGEGAVS